MKERNNEEEGKQEKEVEKKRTKKENEGKKDNEIERRNKGKKRKKERDGLRMTKKKRDKIN